MTIGPVSHLSHAELTGALVRFARCEREATAALIVHLAEFDARRLYEPARYPSLFKYCMAVLHLSEDAVYNRIEVARAVRRYPVLAEMLVTGALSPTTARLVADHLTAENQEPLLAAASFKSKQAVDELLAHVFPQPDVAARVRKIPSRPGTIVPAVRPESGGATEVLSSEPAEPAGVTSSRTIAPAGPRGAIRPVAPQKYEIRFTASEAMREELREAQDLLGHAIPSGDIAAVIGRALSLLVRDLKRKKCAATAKPSPPRAPDQPATSPSVTAEVKRAVWARDRASCAFVAVDGHRCGARRFLEFHHVVPRGVGGPATVENIALRCRAHNGHEVDLYYGPGKRRIRTEEATRSGASRPPAPVGGEGSRMSTAGAG